MKKILKILLALLLVVVLALGGLIGYAYFTDYKPENQTLVAENPQATALNDTLTYRAMIWNIGYCGLSAEMDFFYDGGENVFPPEEKVLSNLENILQFVKKQDSIDFFLFQEVDKDSRRSHHISQYDSLQALYASFHASFGKNYAVGFVPLPPTSPMGKVKSGLMSLSRYLPQKAVRYSFPGNYTFPKGLFMLDRCFLVNRYTLQNGKELLVVNTHNSAYDDGSLRKRQMDYMKDFLIKEYEKGNFIVVGGDWNQCPPGFEPAFAENAFDTVQVSYIENNYPAAGWNWAFAADVPTNRRVATPYNAETSPTTVIDFYLLSPNIQALALKNINLGFRYSDHQPVVLSFRLAP